MAIRFLYTKIHYWIWSRSIESNQSKAKTEKKQQQQSILNHKKNNKK